MLIDEPVRCGCPAAQPGRGGALTAPGESRPASAVLQPGEQFRQALVGFVDAALHTG